MIAKILSLSSDKKWLGQKLLSLLYCKIIKMWYNGLREGFGAKNKFMRKITFKIYHWCIPSKHNEHFPHIWREKPFKVLVFALIFLQCLSLILILGMPQTKIFAVISENSLVKLTNEARSESSLLGLSWNESLAEAAELKAEDMLSKSYFAHNSPQGTTPWYWIQKQDTNITSQEKI